MTCQEAESRHRHFSNVRLQPDSAVIAASSNNFLEAGSDVDACSLTLPDRNNNTTAQLEHNRPRGMETRSQARASHTYHSQQQQAQQQQRQPYPQVSTQSSNYPSTSSFASISQPNFPGMLQTAPSGFASAPLPSPSASQPQAYFGALAPTSQPGMQAQQQQQMQQQMQQGHRYQAGQQQQGQMGGGSSYVGQRGDGGGTPETAPFLKDFNLVAEAAKRAQMACLARDLGDVGI